MVRRKKREYKHRVLSQMTVQKNEKNLKQFWKLLEKINPKRNDHLMNVQPLSFLTIKKKILSSNTLQTHRQKQGRRNTIKELEKAAKILKKRQVLTTCTMI